MLQKIRFISSETHFAGASGTKKAMRFAGQIVFVLYLGLFVCDTINIDVLYASFKGDVTFIDDPSISDSLFDIGSFQHSSAFDAPVHSITHQKFTAKDHRNFGNNNRVKNVINEDEDSPGVADAVLSSSFAEQGELPRPESEAEAEDAVQTLDRTISYQRILI
jgi:hypothetical protein